MVSEIVAIQPVAVTAHRLANETSDDRSWSTLGVGLRLAFFSDFMLSNAAFATPVRGVCSEPLSRFGMRDSRSQTTGIAVQMLSVVGDGRQRTR
jgi:hypothetical protein